MDFYTEFQRLIPPPWDIGIIPAVFHEIEQKIEKNRQNNRFIQQYHLARQILERNPYRLINPTPAEAIIFHVDEQLLLIAQRLANPTTRVYIATNDKAFRHRCRNGKIPTIYVRQRRKIALDEEEEH